MAIPLKGSSPVSRKNCKTAGITFPEIISEWMNKILFIKPADYSFTVNDQKILEKHFRVKAFLINQKNAGFHFIWRIINLILFIIFNSGGTRLMITWFADYHAAIMVFMGKILNIKVVIIAGGQGSGLLPGT